MKKYVPIVFCLSSLLAPLANAANVCVLVIDQSRTGRVGTTTLSCDGEPIKMLTPISRVTTEEISGQVNKLYLEGMHLINCQVDTIGKEFICTMAK